MTTSNFRQGQGRLVVDRYDFQKHIEGTDFRHKAIGIDLEAPLTALSNADDVQTAFDNLNDYIEAQSGIGQGFITIGDGYNTWHAANGSVNYDADIPALNVVLQPIFDAIIAGSGLAAGYTRIKYGGIVVIKAGTYIVTDTIDVPPGITIMGEGWGTKIVNATRLDLTVTPPEVDLIATPKPVFRIKADLDRAVTDTIIGSDTFAFNRQTRICNLMISDNFPEPTQTGDNKYLLAQNRTGNTPLISQEAGSYLSLNNVGAFGRVAYSVDRDVSWCTTFAVQLDTSTAVSTGTILNINNCFMDGFSQPIQFLSIGASNDYLQVTDSKIKSHGWLAADGTTSENNCIIAMNDNNANITDNDFYGNHTLLQTVVYIDSTIPAPALQAVSKIVVASNNFTIDKSSAATLTPSMLDLNSGITSPATKFTCLIYGNTFQEVFGFKIENAVSSLFEVNANRVLLPISVVHRIYTISTSTYTVDSNAPDYLLLADTTSTAITITLPAHEAGRKIIIKDVGFNASTNNITLARSGGTGNIDDYAGNRIIANNGASWTLISNGTNWYIVG